MCTETRREHDAAGRQTKLIENYVDGNPSTGAADEDRTTQTAYNADGLVSTLTAQNPTTGDQVTTYVYGTTLTDSEIARSDLLRAVIYPDSDDAASPLGNGPDGVYDRVEHGYNRQGQTMQTKDQNETVHAFDFDKLGRPTQDRVTTLGSGVDGTVLRIGRAYEVRGLVERITSYDNATVGSGSVVNEVQMAYNGFQQLVAEYQEHGGAVNISSTPKVQYAFSDGSANRARLTGIVYPDGRLLRYEYNSGHDDHLSRVSFLADDNGGSIGTHLTEYAYLGLNVFVKVDYTEPQIRYDLAAGAGDDPYDGLDRFDRVVDLLWRNYGAGADAEHLKYGYDRASNRLWRQNLVSAALSPPVHMDELYGYDGLYQLQDFQRGELNAAKDALVAGTLAFAQQWSFDATGNWNAFKEDDDGSGSWSLDQTRTHSEVNEITAISGGGWIDPAYDRNGNTTTFPQPSAPTAAYSAIYDAWNRLMSLAAGATPVADYRYDGLYRRVTKSTGGVDRHFYFSSRWQVLEERLDADPSADRQVIWGIRYIDDLILRDTPSPDTSSSSSSTSSSSSSSSDITDPMRLYSLADANWNCISIAEVFGEVRERFVYAAYGQSETMDQAFHSRSISSCSWETLFAGYNLDWESTTYNVRLRYLSPPVGRWLTRDRLLYDDGVNFYAYTHNNPTNYLDPAGSLAGRVCISKECYDMAILNEAHSVFARCKPGECCDADGVFNIWECARAGVKHGYFKVAGGVTITVSCRYANRPTVTKLETSASAHLVTWAGKVIGKPNWNCFDNGCRNIKLNKDHHRKGVSDKPEHQIPPDFDPTRWTWYPGFLPSVPAKKTSASDWPTQDVEVYYDGQGVPYIRGIPYGR